MKTGFHSDSPPSDGLVHAVCQWIREEITPHIGTDLRCQNCPMVIDTPYGRGVQACVLRAQELIKIVRGEA